MSWRKLQPLVQFKERLEVEGKSPIALLSLGEAFGITRRRPGELWEGELPREVGVKHWRKTRSGELTPEASLANPIQFVVRTNRSAVIL